MPRRSPRSDAARVRALLCELDALPPLPPVARELMALGDLERADIGAIASLVELDPGLSAGVLAMCRGAHTGLGDRIRTVRHAVVMLGVDAVRRLVIASQACEVLREQGAMLDDRGRGQGGVGPGFDREGYWAHSVAVACASECLARRLPWLGSPDRAFVAGLLHGLGRLALELVAPRASGRLVGLAAGRGLLALEAERAVLGIDHHEAGARLARRWGLPGEVVVAIGGHGEDEPEGGEHAGTVRLVAGAKRLACRGFLGWSGEWRDAGDPAVTLGVESAWVEGLLPEVIASWERRLGELGWGGHGSCSRSAAALIAGEAGARVAAAERRAARGLSRSRAAA